MRPRRAATVLAMVAVIGAIAFAAFANLNSTILLNNPRVDDSLQYTADLTFAGVADLSIRGSCPSANRSTTCDLEVSVALSTTNSGPNYGLATKTIKLELQNSPYSQLALASGQNAFPLHASYTIVNGDPANKVATVDMPSVVGGSTWVYDFLILNPPMVNGRPSLNLILGAQLVPTGILGHSYDLEAGILLPSS